MVMSYTQREELKFIVNHIFIVKHNNVYTQWSELTIQLQKFCVKYKLYSSIRTESWIERQLIDIEFYNGLEKENFRYDIIKEQRMLKIKSIYE